MISTLSPQELTNLEQNGFVVVEASNHPLIKACELRKISQKLYSQKHFKSAAIGETKLDIQAANKIRNDFTLWIDEGNWPADLSVEDIQKLQDYLQFLNLTRETLKNFFRISLNSFETHFAIYPTGHFYKKHVDQTAQNNRRYFSFVLYLNEKWQAADGGHLVGYKGQDKIFDIVPSEGRLIIFFSSLEHEVLPTSKERFSITGWFRND